jgi:holo-[acyl-carrier protein] synthase
MEILGIGIDLVEIGRMEKAIARHEEFVSRVFSPRERELCEDYARPARRYAACFAAKEAASKALGTGVMGFTWQEVEMLRDDKGQPYLALSGRAQELASSKGVDEILISVSHSRGLAVAVAQAVGEEVER